MASVFKNEDQRAHWNKYNNEYSKKNYRCYCLKFNKEKDKDIINYIESNGGSPSIVIRNLVREKIAGGK